MIKVSDCIAEHLVKAGVKHIFMLTGGMSMYMNDSFGNNPNLEVICNHHEQASAMAAESYARLTGAIGVVNVTSGPGSINTLNGVFGAWTDSVPLLVLSGQSKRETLSRTYDMPNLRQLGDQEVDIIEMVERITKYSAIVFDPNSILYHLEKALYLASSGRPGPVWIDIPIDVQASMVEFEVLKHFDPNEVRHEFPGSVDSKIIATVIKRIKQAKRPVILAGSGIRASKSYDLFLRLIEILKIPVTTAWNAHDLLHDDHAYYFGRPGTVGDRPGNFVVQNSDLLLVLGSRLNIRQISYNWEHFAREAFTIVVDIDKNELDKPTLNIDLPVNADLKNFLQSMLSHLKDGHMKRKDEWLEWCKVRRNKYPVVLKEYWDQNVGVNPYCFMYTLSEHLDQGQITVTGDGTACVTSFQAMKIKEGQRLYTNSGCASMGYDLPAAIGAVIGSGGKNVVCLAGDGSMMLNLQELETIVYNNYPIKIFILNNNGYHSMRQSQINFFGGKTVGVGPESGLGFPNFNNLADAFNIPYFSFNSHSQMDKIISKNLTQEGYSICEVFINPDQVFAPKLSSKELPDGRIVSPPLEDLYPFLDREELESNMIIKTIEPD